jgi:high-affinity iron transporter
MAGRWQQYLSEKLSRALSRRSVWFLAGLAFIAVYREVFETILFYAALWTQGQHGAVIGGLLAGALALAAITYVMLRATTRLPIGQFFAVSAWLVGILAIVLVGKGVAALQEAGLIGFHMINGPRVDVLGIYPSTQTLLAQLVVAVAVIGGFAINHFGSRKMTG